MINNKDNKIETEKVSSENNKKLGLLERFLAWIANGNNKAKNMKSSCST
ncbi:MAG: hypothetical protein HQK76_04440 [Desulfobacterales bacterium]|nr:hypothetical protein [Desulfobacterales bacterium]